MYNVLADFHHSSLLQSLIILFEKRFGGNLFRPIGMEWATEGFWKVYDHPATQAQFLSLEQGFNPPDGTRSLNQIKGRNYDKEFNFHWYECHDIDSGFTNKAITLDQFYQADIDIVIASIPQHIEPFRRLCSLHKNHPKFIYQIGNSWNVSYEQAIKVDAIMASAKIGYQGIDVPVIQYHQEFNLDVFQPNDFSSLPDTVTSFVNCFSLDGLFTQDWQLFQKVESLMPDWNFKSLGGQCRDGAAHGAKELADKMKESRFIWHTKNGGDGYGHILHNSAAVGRPLIIKRQYYLGKMGDALIKDGETAIVIDNLNPEEIVNKIIYYNDQNRWINMSKAVFDNFKKVVNFDQEFIDIQNFLSKLL